jgi:hypothetical protein
MASWVTPIFNPDFNNRGFWFFGIWIPLSAALLPRMAINYKT